MFDPTGTKLDRIVGGAGALAAGAGLGAMPGLMSGNTHAALLGAGVGAFALGTPWGRKIIQSGLSAGVKGLGKASVASAKRIANFSVNMGKKFIGADWSTIGANSLFTASQVGMNLTAGGLALAEKAVRYGEGVFVHGANVLASPLFGRKASNMGEALELLFPFKNNPGIFDPLSKGSLSKHFLNTPQAKEFLQGLKETDGVLKISKDTIMSNKHLLKDPVGFMEKVHGGTVGGVETIGRAASDSRRVGLNPRVLRRVTGAALAISTISGIAGSMANNSPDPSVYYSAGNIRHINDMGADASYGRALMGRGSRL